MTRIQCVLKGMRQHFLPRDEEEWEEQCVTCPYFDPDVPIEQGCKRDLYEDTVSLIKELDAECTKLRRQLLQMHEWAKDFGAED